jgi:hypothetical protein
MVTGIDADAIRRIARELAAVDGEEILTSGEGPIRFAKA